MAIGILKQAIPISRVATSLVARLLLAHHHASETQAQKVDPKAKSTNNFKTCSIYQWNPDKPPKTELQDSQINLKECGSMVLDALIEIKNEMDLPFTF
ncbi:hypothetical protein NL676_015797 [Syzygium grande]|nr:hypothetical protein NL676_015797 [Syzygium grande]